MLLALTSSQFRNATRAIITGWYKNGESDIMRLAIPNMTMHPAIETMHRAALMIALREEISTQSSTFHLVFILTAVEDRDDNTIH